MARTVILPKLGQTMEEGTIVEWLVQEGDPVERGDILFQVESDKAVLEVESRHKGTLLKILAGADAQIPVLTPVGIIGNADEDISDLLDELASGGSAPTAAAEAPPEPAETPADQTEARAGQPTGRLFASPRARKCAREKGVNLEQVTGSGPNGRIIEQDVLAYLAKRPAATQPARRLAERENVLLEELQIKGTRIRSEDVRAAVAARMQPEIEPSESQAQETVADVVQPMRGMRAIIAERMAASAQSTAAITLQSEVDATEFVALRTRLRDALAEELGFNIGYNDLLGVIVARCLIEFPYMNVQLTEEGIRQMPQVNVGLAVDSPRGLLVPVVHNADRLGIKAFARAFRELVERAREGRSLPDELTGGTFTITNLGMFGVDMFTPIINLPETAILGVGRIRPVPTVVDGEIVVRQTMWLSLTADHRLVDGAPAARFLQGIVRYIESPYLLLT